MRASFNTLPNKPIVLGSPQIEIADLIPDELELVRRIPFDVASSVPTVSGIKAKYAIFQSGRSRSPSQAVRAEFTICRRHATTLIDSGAALSCIRSDFARSLQKSSRCAIIPANVEVFACNGATTTLAEQTTITVSHGSISFQQDVFLVDTLPSQVLLGCDFLQSADAVLHFRRRELFLFTPNHSAIIPFRPKNSLQPTHTQQPAPASALERSMRRSK